MARLHILLVDDDAEFADLTAESLRADGHRVSVARNAATATELARELRPDVVLLELELPDRNGYEVARDLRQALPEASPIIVVTGVREAGPVEDVDLILSKPVPTDLFAGLIEYMRRCRQRSIGPRM